MEEKSRLHLCYVFICVLKWLVDLVYRVVHEGHHTRTALLRVCAEAIDYFRDDSFARFIIYFIYKDDHGKFGPLRRALTPTSEALNETNDRIQKAAEGIKGPLFSEMDKECRELVLNMPAIIAR